jgi:hypothetical protein
MTDLTAARMKVMTPEVSCHGGHKLTQLHSCTQQEIIVYYCPLVQKVANTRFLQAIFCIQLMDRDACVGDYTENCFLGRDGLWSSLHCPQCFHSTETKGTGMDRTRTEVQVFYPEDGGSKLLSTADSIA